jgi:hypothetical protein
MDNYRASPGIVRNFLYALVAAAFSLGSVAQADETATALVISKATESRLYATVNEGMSAAALERPDDKMAIPEMQPRLVTFIKDCAEMDAIPFITISDKPDKRVFVGVNFDGVLGITARM